MSFMSSTGPQPVGNVVAMRLQAATTNLTELEQLVRSGDLDPRVLQDFRNAVDLIRGTAWAVQQWIGLQEESGDPYTLLPVLAAQRVKRATQLARDLTVDLESVEIGYETPGLKELYNAVNRLQERLMPLFQK
jgi:hypothetical protein